MKEVYVRFIGKGQMPNQPSYLSGAECIWGKEIEISEFAPVTMELAKQILVDGEKVANERFGWEHKFYKISIEVSKEKKINYNVNTNTLTVWENDLPIYQNANGVICKDRVALADCIL